MTDVVEIVRHHAERHDAMSGVTVIGTGPGADGLAERLAETFGIGTTMVVVASDDPDEIRAGLETVDDLGTVVLVCNQPPTGVAADLYGDLHARSLTVVGVRRSAQR